MSLSYDEFVNFYKERNYLPNDVGRRKNKLNEKQIKARYEKYLNSEAKKLERIERLSEDPKWIELKSKLDLTKCVFIKYLEKVQFFEELNILYEKAGPWINIIDPAHIFGKGAYPHMKYDLDNVIPLNRYVHSCLDQNKDPITGKSLNKEEKDSYWRLIIGEEKFNELQNRSMNE